MSMMDDGQRHPRGWNSRALLNSFRRLKEIESSRGYLTKNDLFSALSESGEVMLSESEMHAHASLLVESTLRPVLNSALGVSLRIVNGVHNPQSFFSNLLTYLVQSNPYGQTVAATEHLRHEAMILCGGSPSQLPPSHQMMTRAWAPLPPQHQQLQQLQQQQLQQQQQQHMVSRLEASDHISKFLAMLRKNGMDILFPIACQDKVLAAIYVAVRAPDAAPLAHRDLIDVVISCKSEFANVESISKTKVRGVLALLKHAEVLVAQPVAEGLPVQLRLSSTISSFDDVRNRLDSFLLAFSTEFELKVPQELWQHIIWPKANRSQRLADSLQMIEHLQAIYERCLAESKSREGSEALTKLTTPSLAPVPPPVPEPGADKDHATMLQSLRVRVPSIHDPDISPLTSRDDWSRDATPITSRTASLDVHDSCFDFDMSHELGEYTTSFNASLMEGIALPPSMMQFGRGGQQNWAIPHAAVPPPYSLWTPPQVLPSLFVDQLVSSGGYGSTHLTVQTQRFGRSNQKNVHLLQKLQLDELIESASASYAIDAAIRELTSPCLAAPLDLSRSSADVHFKRDQPFRAEDVDTFELLQERYFQSMLTDC